jgi:mRNA (guanine-N7-)-methyltransferase
LRDRYSDPNIKFDIVSVQFSFHYSFETVEQAQKMLLNISQNLAPGGFFIGTTPNSNRIVYGEKCTQQL